MQGFLWTMMIPTIPLLAKDNLATEIQLGMIVAIPALTTIISCIPGSSLGLRYGKRTLFIWSQSAGLACVPEKRATAIGYAMAASTLGSILSPVVGFAIARTLPRLVSHFEGSVAARYLRAKTGSGRCSSGQCYK